MCAKNISSHLCVAFAWGSGKSEPHICRTFRLFAFRALLKAGLWSEKLGGNENIHELRNLPKKLILLGRCYPKKKASKPQPTHLCCNISSTESQKDFRLWKSSWKFAVNYSLRNRFHCITLETLGAFFLQWNFMAWFKAVRMRCTKRSANEFHDVIKYRCIEWVNVDWLCKKLMTNETSSYCVKKQFHVFAFLSFESHLRQTFV